MNGPGRVPETEPIIKCRLDRQPVAFSIPAMSEEAAVRREVVPMNLLIVDDDESIRETCATVSEQCGMKAVAVATADEALEVLEHSPIDILLTDLKLQQTNGVELLKQVHDVHPEVAVVVLTQYGTIESGEAAFFVCGKDGRAGKKCRSEEGSEFCEGGESAAEECAAKKESTRRRNSSGSKL